MTLLPATESFLESVERHAGHKFSHRQEIGVMIECAKDPSRRDKFDDLVFSSKFLTKAYDILRRQHMDPEETEKLSQEFAAKLKLIPGLIESVISDCPPDFRKNFSDRFFPVTQDAMEQLIGLLRELSRVKNYLLDEGRLPDTNDHTLASL